MADSLDDKANKKNPKIDAEAIKTEDLLKARHQVSRDIMPELYTDIDGKDPKTSSP